MRTQSLELPIGLPVALVEEHSEALKKLKAHQSLNRNELARMVLESCAVGRKIWLFNLRAEMVAAIDSIDESPDTLKALRDKLLSLIDERFNGL